MPYQSDKQERLMRAVAHSPSFAKKVGIPPSVGQKFEAHKATGGPVKESTMKKIFAGKESKAEEAKEKVAAKKAGMSYKAAERKFEGEKYASGGGIRGAKTVTKTGTPQEEFAPNYRTPVRSPELGFANGGGIRGARTVTQTGTPQEEFAPNYRTPVRSPSLSYANGGKVAFPAVKGSAVKSGLDEGNKSADGIAQRGKTRGDNIVMKAKGGSCYARGGGVETKGKTRGRFV